MAKEFEFDCSAHPVVEGVNRIQKVYFSTPEEINHMTGMLLLIAGFGGAPDANIYKKMRRIFADCYNLVVVQTEYFGTEFMGKLDEFQFHYDRFQRFCDNFPLSYRQDFITSEGQVKLAELLAADLPPLEIPLLSNTKESDVNFVEMGPLQAIDNINALITVRSILRENGYNINEDKTIAFGHSHGAYLALVANRLFPSHFSLIVDGSGWLLPIYLSDYRFADGKYKNHTILQYTLYRIASHEHDVQIRDLRFLYRNFKNSANIVTYQGVDDLLVDLKEKSNLFKQIPYSFYNLITPELVDGQIFKSTAHGDFDFLRLLKHVLDTYPELTMKKQDISTHDEQVFETDFAKYRFFIKDFGPHMEITKK